MSKGQSKNGVRLTINNSSPYSTMIITDIDVEPGIDTVILDIGNSLPPYVSGEVQLKKVNKQFTDVKTLIFGGRVTSAEISNYMFPNVTHITVQECSSKRYITKKLVGRNGCLMAVATSAKGNIIEFERPHPTSVGWGRSSNALTSIEIPSNVESIGSNAFKGCRNLSNVILNEGLENVGPGAFNGCNLTEITIPKSVKKVHDFSFQGVKRVNIKGILPAYFLHAILKTDNGMQYDDSFNIVEITDGQNKLFFPMYLESDDKSVLQHNLNYKTLAEVVEDENFISKPGEYSKHIEVKQDMAIKIYGHNQDSETRTYLRRVATNITKRYISKKDEDGLVEFLKFNLMTTTAINKILPQVENAGMTSATAYLLNAINNAGGNQKTFKI